MRVTWAALAFAGMAAMSCADTSAPKAQALWSLTQLNGQPFMARATLSLTQEGRIAGRGPCNSYSGIQTAQFPDFKVRGVLSTKRACPELQAEAEYFSALRMMTRIAIMDDTLTLEDATGRQMVFTKTE